MARLSDIIEEFIKALLTESEGELELKRNELADYFDCAPSQINYVLATRFSLNQGYYIESRRGGGGFIKIVQLDMDKDDYLLFLITEGIGTRISEQDAGQFVERMGRQEFITEREARMMRAAITDKAIAIPSSIRDNLRSSILKAMITAVMYART